MLGVGAIHDEDGLPRPPSPWCRVINTQNMDRLAGGVVAQAWDADEPGRNWHSCPYAWLSMLTSRAADRACVICSDASLTATAC
jgi:hypothetical protein